MSDSKEAAHLALEARRLACKVYEDNCHGRASPCEVRLAVSLDEMADLVTDLADECAPAPSESPSPATVTDAVAATATSRARELAERARTDAIGLTERKEFLAGKRQNEYAIELERLASMEQRANIEFVLCKGNNEAVQEVVEHILTGSDAKKVGE